MALMAGTSLEDSVVSGAAVAASPDPEVVGCKYPVSFKQAELVVGYYARRHWS